MTSNTRTSLSRIQPAPQKERCATCLTKAFQAICECGKKFDFACLEQHRESINKHFRQCVEDTRKIFQDIDQNQTSANNENSEEQIQRWLDERTQQINEIAAQFRAQIRTGRTLTNSVEDLKADFDLIKNDEERSDHEKIDFLTDIQNSLREQVGSCQQQPTISIDMTQLDQKLAEMLNFNEKRETVWGASASSASASENTKTSYQIVESLPVDLKRVPSTEDIGASTPTSEKLSSVSSTDSWVTVPKVTEEVKPSVRFDENVRVETYIRDSNPDTNFRSPIKEVGRHTHTESIREEPQIRIPPSPSSPSPINPILTNSNPITNIAPPKVESPPSETETNDDEGEDYDAGATSKIEHEKGIDIPVREDGAVGTVCCNKNEIIFIDQDPNSKETQIVIVPNIQNPNIVERYNLSDFHPDPGQILDIVYSQKHETYLFLTPKVVRIFNKNEKKLDDLYVTRGGAVLKRMTINEYHIYIGAGSSEGDVIIRLNLDGSVSVEKTLREILPPKISRHPSSTSAEIVDVATNSNDHLAITYRFDRRREVGICLYTLVAARGPWTFSKQLLLNECWQEAVRHTPRLDWSQELRAFVLIEYITGHLILFDTEGEVTGERRFFHDDQSAAPINISISGTGWLSTRYETLVNIKKIRD